MNSNNPLVSVIMPVYNAGDFLVDAIQSILYQTFQNFELIIVNDASKDNSLKIIKRFKRLNPDKIKVISLTRTLNKGGDSCANLGFQMAKGKFIARMDADDIAHPERLEKQIQFMQKYKDIIILGTQAYVIDKDGKITGEKREPISHENIKHDYFIYHPIIHPSVMIRRKFLPKRNFLYRIKYSANNDLLTFFELLGYGKFANLPEKLLFYRVHGKNDSLVNPREKFFNTLKIRLLAYKNFGYEPSLKAVIMNILQFLCILLLPSFLITPLYMVWRGLSKPQISLKSLSYKTAYS